RCSMPCSPSALPRIVAQREYTPYSQHAIATNDHRAVVQWSIGEEDIYHKIAADIGVHPDTTTHVILKAGDILEHDERPIPSLNETTRSLYNLLDSRRLQRRRN